MESAYVSSTTEEMIRNNIDYKKQLLDLLYNSRISEEQIDNIISVVTNQDDETTPEEKLEQMINLLIESGDSTLHVDDEGAMGYGHSNIGNHILDQYFDQLQSIFPDLCPNFLLEFCKSYDNFDFNRVVEDLSCTNYGKVEKDPLDTWEHLKQMLPNADPIYLRNQARILFNRPDELQQFLQDAIDKGDYPTMQDYLIQREKASEIAIYVNHFSIEEFLEKVPKPFEFFLDPKRKSILDVEHVPENDLMYALIFLYNTFPFQRKREIEKVFRQYKRHLVNAHNRLKTLPKAFRRPRKISEEGECQNEVLLQEITFLKYKNTINQFIKQKDERYRLAHEEAVKYNLLQTCQCCFDDALIPEECYFCNKNCTFCKECVKRGAEEVIGRGDTNFPCLADCNSEFSYYTLQMVLDRKVFQRLCQRRQIEEIRKANIDGLETCPFCDFSMIPAEGDKIFKCENIECLKESCRECRHIAHLPMKCSEIEYDEDVKMRVFIEKKMTEALLRKCWKCSKPFYKENGCNKMTCICGAKMCYICGEAVNDYSHFGSGSKCPLYTENLKEFHLNRVMRGAADAKSELGVNQVKFDPTRDLTSHIA